MSWCDKLASTPGVGFRLDHHFASSDVILDALAPILNKWVVGDKQQFTMNQHQPFDVGFTTNDGYEYGIDSSKTFVRFNHKMKAKPVSGGPPVMEMLSRPLPYSKLLQEVSERVIEATLLVPGPENRKFTRVGIITYTRVANDDIPPGIARFIKYIGRPWKDIVDQFNIKIVAEIEKTSTWSDRCIHHLIRVEDPEELLSITFDWQRTFTSGHPITLDNLQESVAKAEKSSNKYFEDLAEGNRFDEHIIGRTS